MRAHPRSRGENRFGGLLNRALEGLIPAHAGKTAWAAAQRGRRRAHPRSRGENRAGSWIRSRRAGSSPLTRGKHVPIDDYLRSCGLIPAHAGKTFKHIIRMIRQGAHPRSRGENRQAPAGRARTLGSSPLTRGKQVRLPWGKGGTGLIPAHAGKTARAQSAARTVGAHPRSRGENWSPARWCFP